MASIIGFLVVDIQWKDLKELGSLFYLQTRCNFIPLGVYFGGEGQQL